MLRATARASWRRGADVRPGSAGIREELHNCHQIGGKGSKIGPQLDGIGIRGLDRLLEDVLDPNRNVDQAFRLTTLVLKNGQVIAGLLLKEEGRGTGTGRQPGQGSAHAEEGGRRETVSQFSPMPANLADQCAQADFYNLLAYLLSQKPPSK